MPYHGRSGHPAKQAWTLVLMQVGVTGAAGFTGRYVMAALELAGHNPVGIGANIIDASALDRDIAGSQFDAVIHLAAQAFVASDDLAGFYAVNQVGSFNLLRSLARHCPGCRVLLTSSAQVYGETASGLVSEDHITRPANHYALSKLAMEMGASFWGDVLSIVVARPFNYTGRGQESRYLIPKIVSHFKQLSTVIELGNIAVERDFGDVRAVAQAYVGLIEADLVENPVNVATGYTYSVRDVIDIARRITGHDPQIEVNSAFVRPNDVQRLVGDNARLRNILPGWAPIKLEETLAWMLSA